MNHYPSTDSLAISNPICLAKDHSCLKTRGMNLELYLKERQTRLEQAPKYRKLCQTCIQPDFSCYCPFLQTFQPSIEFAILIHPIEVRRRVATGRMSHLVLQGSHLIPGQNYSNNDQVNQLLNDPTKQCLLLYPGKQSTNLSFKSPLERAALLEPGKKLVIFVIDGTWATARKMVRQSVNLQGLPRISFSRDLPSQFRVRKQPKAHCLSTIEAIHHVIELLRPENQNSLKGDEAESREHDKLLFVFNKMVERQLYFIERGRKNPELCRYHRERQKALISDRPLRAPKSAIDKKAHRHKLEP